MCPDRRRAALSARRDPGLHCAEWEIEQLGQLALAVAADPRPASTYRRHLSAGLQASAGTENFAASRRYGF